jgi:hypothetical protein
MWNIDERILPSIDIQGWKEAALSTGNPGKIHVFFIKEPSESKW